VSEGLEQRAVSRVFREIERAGTPIAQFGVVDSELPQQADGLDILLDHNHERHGNVAGSDERIWVRAQLQQAPGGGQIMVCQGVREGRQVFIVFLVDRLSGGNQLFGGRKG